MVFRASQLLRGVDQEELRQGLESAALDKNRSLKERSLAIGRLTWRSEKTLLAILEDAREHPLVKADAVWNTQCPEPGPP